MSEECVKYLGKIKKWGLGKKKRQNTDQYLKMVEPDLKHSNTCATLPKKTEGSDLACTGYR